MAALWRSAIDRLTADARRVGAHGVIGVTLREETISMGVHQLQLTGTAVVAPDFTEELTTPFLSLLGLADLLRLLQRGWIPTGIGWGVAAIHVHRWGNNAWWQGTTFTNAEMQVPTQAFQDARHRCQLHVRGSLAQQPGDVLVGSSLTVERVPQKCGSQDGGSLVRARMVGTAISRYRSSAVSVRPVVRLEEGSA